MSRKSFSLIRLIQLLCATLCFLWIIYFTCNRPRLISTRKFHHTTSKTGNGKNVTKVVLGLVSCGDGSNGIVYLDQTTVMLKSVMISAEIYKLEEIEIHHFLERAGDDEMFQRLFKSMGYNTNLENGATYKEASEVKLRRVVHFLEEVNYPRQFEQFMIYHKRYRCGFLRFYFPTALPNVDALIYMDADSLVTGNIIEIWNQFSKMPAQMVGLVNDREPENDQFSEVPHTLSGIPLLTRHGYNSGFVWMNLTRMRTFGWEARFTRLFEDYSKILENPVDQKILNILVYFNPGAVTTLPCTFNFAHTACTKGLFCKAATEDPYGIQIIHGYGRKFRMNEALYGVYKQYQDFTYTRMNFTLEVTKKDLIEPIRKWYEESNLNPADSKTAGKCRGSLNRFMFRNFFDENKF